MCQSDTFPPQSLDTNVTIPFGATPINILKVLECLYSDHVNHCAFKEVGLSIYNSVQSTTTLVSGCPVNSFGKLHIICSRVGQAINDKQ